LIAYHRDQQEPGVQPGDARQPAKVPRQEDFESAQQREAPMTDHAMVPAAPRASPAKVSADFPENTKQAGPRAAGEVVARTQPDAGNSRRLLPSSDNSSNPPAGTRLSQRSAANNRRLSGLANSFPSTDVLRTAGTGLGIALGLLLLCVWLFRRNTPSPTTPLPKEVVSVLGRAQLATRQFVQLLRVGNKLVLVSVTPEGTEPITEVTEPVEVDRLLSLCMRNHTQSTTAEFQQVLNQLSREGAKGFLGK
jgi:flagellar biogenesis protein FliO